MYAQFHKKSMKIECFGNAPGTCNFDIHVQYRLHISLNTSYCKDHYHYGVKLEWKSEFLRLFCKDVINSSRVTDDVH